jgi:HlyD family secretion protein
MKTTGRRILLGAFGAAARLEVVIECLSNDAARVRPGMAVRREGWGGAGALPAIVRTVEPAAFTRVSALGVEEQPVNVIADLAAVPAGLGDGYRAQELRDGLRVAAR